jgi:hypothetical protein
MRKRQRKPRPQFKGFISLKALLPSHSVAIRKPHFEDRVIERGFDTSLIQRMWDGTHWRPGDHGRWLVELPVPEEDLLWSLTVDFADDDRPIFVTICDRSLKALSREFLGVNHVSAAMGGN